MLPKVRKDILVCLKCILHINDTTHVSVSLDCCNIICNAYIRCIICSKKVTDLLNLCPTGNSYELNFYVVLIEHSLLDIICVNIVRRV